MKLVQAVSLCASVVNANTGAPLLPHIGLSPSSVTGISHDLRACVQCETGIATTLWVGARALVEVLSKLGPDAALRVDKGALFIIAGKTKLKVATHQQGPTYEPAKDTSPGELDAADLLRAIEAVARVVDPESSRAFLRGVILDTDFMWGASGHRAHVAMLAGAKRMKPIPLSAAKAIGRAIEATGAKVVQTLVGANESEFVIGDVRLRAPLLDEPPVSFSAFAPKPGAEMKSATVSAKEFAKAVSDAALARAVVVKDRDKGDPPIRMRSEGGVLHVESADVASAECPCDGEVDDVSLMPAYAIDAVTTLGGDDVTIMTGGEWGPVYFMRGDEVRHVLQRRP